MVKRANVLDGAQAEAEIPYEETRLGRTAPRARRRLAVLLLVGALFAVVETVLARTWWTALAAGALVLTAWGAHRGSLGGIVAAGLAAALAAGIPLVVWGVLGLSRAEVVPALAVALLGAAALPDVVLLLRDAELQHAYGRWARRDA